jgi:hypothetical protein
MPTYKVLAQSAPSATTATTLYTAGNAKTPMLLSYLYTSYLKDALVAVNTSTFPVKLKDNGNVVAVVVSNK